MTDLPIVPGGARRLSLVQPQPCRPTPCSPIIGTVLPLDLVRQFEGLVNIRRAAQGAGIKLHRNTTTEED